MSLVVRNLNAWYGRARALFDVSLDVAPGEAAALLGRNGAGKSTTFRAILGLLKTRSGEVSFRRMRSCGSASAMCRRTGASSPI